MIDRLATVESIFSDLCIRTGLSPSSQRLIATCITRNWLYFNAAVDFELAEIMKLQTAQQARVYVDAKVNDMFVKLHALVNDYQRKWNT